MTGVQTCALPIFVSSGNVLGYPNTLHHQHVPSFVGVFHALVYEGGDRASSLVYLAHLSHLRQRFIGASLLDTTYDVGLG